MKVTVLEFACGGGLRSEHRHEPVTSTSPLDTPPLSVPPQCDNQASFAELFREGSGMLMALSADLVSCGHEVTVCIDPLIANESSIAELKANDIAIEFISHERSWIDTWADTGKKSDQTIVIAPELDYSLDRIVAHLRRSDIQVICSSGPFLHATSDKLEFATRLKRAIIPHPLTISVEEALAGQNNNIASFSNSLTLKRRDGAGCVEMKHFRDWQQFLSWFDDSTHESIELKKDPSNWIVQPWMQGRAASMAIIANENAFRIVGASQQFIELASSNIQRDFQAVSYKGGQGPIDWIPLDELTLFADRILAALPPKARGWIGIDFLATEDAAKASDLVAIEVNPRMTTSYLGYRQCYGPSIANELLGVVSNTPRFETINFRFDA